MKVRISVFLFLLLQAVFSLSDAVSPTCLAQKRVAASAKNVGLEERIRRVENGLLPAVIVKGEPAAAMNIADRLQFYKTPGVSVAVINNGKIEWARGYGVLEKGGTAPVTAETLFQAASISKPVAAMGAMRLVQDKKLNLDEDVNKKLGSWKIPENEFTKEQKVTLRGLLSHSNSLTVHGFGGYSSDTKPPTLVQILDGTPPANSKPIRVDGAPYKTWRYAGGGYVVMQMLVENVTREPYPAFMEKAVLEKIGMKRSTYEQPLPRELWDSAARGHKADGEKVKGNWNTYPEMTAAGLWTTPSDLARFAIEIQKSIAGKSNKVLSAKTTNEMLAPQIGGWGLGPELTGQDGSKRFGHGGSNAGFQCLMVAYFGTGQGAVVMTNSDQGGGVAGEVMRSIAREYGWLDYLSKERVVVPLEPKIYGDYAGKYQLTPEATLTIVNEDGKLSLQGAGQLFPASETEFFLKTVAAEIVFVRDAMGKVNGLILRQGKREMSAKRID